MLHPFSILFFRMHVSKIHSMQSSDFYRNDLTSFISLLIVLLLTPIRFFCANEQAFITFLPFHGNSMCHDDTDTLATQPFCCRIFLIVPLDPVSRTPHQQRFCWSHWFSFLLTNIRCPTDSWLSSHNFPSVLPWFTRSNLHKKIVSNSTLPTNWKFLSQHWKSTGTCISKVFFSLTNHISVDQCMMIRPLVDPRNGR